MEPGRTIAPVAFEVTRNGRSLCIAGLGGKPGVLTVILHWASPGQLRNSGLEVGGLNSRTFEGLKWARQALRIGDEIVIRVVESANVTRPKSREKPLTREWVEKQEVAYLRKTAKKYGYKLVKG